MKRGIERFTLHNGAVYRRAIVEIAYHHKLDPSGLRILASAVRSDEMRNFYILKNPHFTDNMETTRINEYAVGMLGIYSAFTRRVVEFLLHIDQEPKS